ncbi:hypothetical protein [Aliarcobacter vitoriensis]|uniref:Lipoprotein n=1 Tax=Aliarcobacter vitoriensis TaxID=2011099 RepID=A0A366MQK8_9BACT|nr:hypothetical protein [Aliarcobacter vitoriensis]RBQ28327.1 hypothetical protein CRU91_09565 [Aliarcobacter vitoriensis]
MYTKIMISLLFISLGFSACGTKNNIYNNISKKENYKILDEVSIIGSESNSTTFSKYSTTPYKCKQMRKEYDKEILNTTLISKLLQERNVKIKYIEPTKKVLIIKPEGYFSKLDENCTPSRIDIKIELYDTEEISKNWNKDDIKNYANDIKFLNKDNLIYSQEFTLGEYHNTSGYSAFITFPNLDKNKDIDKFHQDIIKELEKVMKFPR